MTCTMRGRYHVSVPIVGQISNTFKVSLLFAQLLGEYAISAFRLPPGLFRVLLLLRPQLVVLATAVRDGAS